MKALCCWVLLICCSHAYSKETLHIALPEWQGFTDSDNSGIYNNVINAVFNEYEIHRDYVSYVQAKQRFLEGKSDVFVGADEPEFPDALYPHWHLDVESAVFLIQLAEQSTYDVILRFNGQKIAWREGLALDAYVKGHYDLTPVSTLEQGLEHLKSGKVSILLEYQYRLPDKMPKTFVLQPLINTKKLWMVFQNSAKGKRLAEKYDENLVSLMQRRELSALYGSRFSNTGFPSY